MPHTKEYKGKKGHHASHTTHKRRPRHEMSEANVEAVESQETVFEGVEDVNTEAQNEGVSAHEAHIHVEDVHTEPKTDTGSSEDTTHFHFDDQAKAEKVHLNFYGSDLIRMKAPQVMDLADTVADEWMKDGQFQGLPVGNPIAQLAAAKALRKAKDVEKKLEEKGVFVMAKMGFDYLKSKIDKK